MKKESVRQKEAREQMKHRAAQVAATVGIAGGGTAFAAAGLADNASMPESDVSEATVEAQTVQNINVNAAVAPQAAPAPSAAGHHVSATSAPAGHVAVEMPQAAETSGQPHPDAAEPIAEPQCAEDSIAEPQPVSTDEVVVPEVELFTSASAVNGVYTVSNITMEEPDGSFEEVPIQEVETEPIYEEMMSTDPISSAIQYTPGDIASQGSDPDDTTGPEIDPDLDLDF